MTAYTLGDRVATLTILVIAIVATAFATNWVTALAVWMWISVIADRFQRIMENSRR